MQRTVNANFIQISFVYSYNISSCFTTFQILERSAQLSLETYQKSLETYPPT